MFLNRSMRHVRHLALGAVLLVASGCNVITGIEGGWGSEERRLSRARDTWIRSGVYDYEYVVRRSCYCLLAGVAVRVVVLGGAVADLRIDATGEPLSFMYASSYPTIDGLHARVQRAIDQRAWRLEVSYDSRWGFPTDLYIDLDRNIADEEEGYTILAFRALR